MDIEKYKAELEASIYESPDGRFHIGGKEIEKVLNEVQSQALHIHGAVSGSLTPFDVVIKILRDLADLQNGAPLEQHRKEWEETMDQVYDFLNRWEGQ